MARPVSFESAYAKEIGITRQHLRRLGGFERLQVLSPLARALLLQPHAYGSSRTIRKGGLTRRGMRRAPDIRTREE